MLTYTSPSAMPAQQEPNARPWLLLLLCVFWIVPGLCGHDPWKPFEAQATDIVWNFVRGQSWLLPTLVDTIYLERNPLFFWIAAVLAKGLPNGWLPLHDIVRVTSGIFTGLAMWGVGLAGLELYGRRFGRYAVLILIGSIGLTFWGHQASPQVLSLAACSWLIYALVWGQRRPLPAGLLLGIAILTLFLGGTPRELILALLLILGAFVCGRWRYIHIMVVLGSALAIAIPLGLLWPLALKQAYPQVYQQWLNGLLLKEESLLRFQLTGLNYYLRLLPWFSWPALPMSLWSLWHNRHHLTDRKWVMPITFLCVIFIWLFLFVPDMHDHTVLPILLPLALLGAGGVDTQRRGLASALNWFAMMTFGLTACAVWLLWSAIHLGFPAKLIQRASEFNTSYIVTYSYPAIGFALLMTLTWCWIISRQRQLGKQALINWTCGLTLLWGLSMSLLLPWLDRGKTYRYVAQDIRMALPLNDQGCIVGQGLNHSVEASLHYFSGIKTKKIEAGQGMNCRLLLVQASGDTYFAPTQAKLLWAGSRQGETQEKFYLYQLPK